jgi:predicted AAA+ superfamily ATPase
MVIGEIQRYPALVLPIKMQVDRYPRPGQFLLSGSARLLGLRDLPDSLVGRMETIELWPFSQGEIDGAPDGFVDAVFSERPPRFPDSAVTRSEYVERVLRGGFPESVTRRSARERSRFMTSYLSDIVSRDVAQLAEIERVGEMRRMLYLLAARSGQLLVVNALAGELGLPHPTVKRYLQLLQEVFLVKRIPAWTRNLSSRATATPKLAMVDSGLAANLLGVSAEWLLRPGDATYGGLLEAFVRMELARQITWSRTQPWLYHYRTRDQVEVDAVLVTNRGTMVGVEVKASSTVRSEDFRGLRHLADRLGQDFLLGVVLYTGTAALSFGPKLRALPVSALWTTPAP